MSVCFEEVYRYWNKLNKDHFYTTNSKEIGTTAIGTTGAFGYVFERVEFYVQRDPRPGMLPVYRYCNIVTSQHLYTANVAEIGTLTLGAVSQGYRYEGVLGYLFPQEVVGSKAVHRYRHTNGGYLFTTDPAEVGTTTPGATGKHKYVYEGVLGYSLPFKLSPVSRYVGANGAHYFATHKSDLPLAESAQTPKADYLFESNSFYVLGAFAPGFVPVYTYLQASTGACLLSTSPSEVGTCVAGEVGRNGFKCVGLLGYVGKSAGTGLLPLYKYSKRTPHSAHPVDYIYTTRVNFEKGSQSGVGYNCEGILGYVIF